MFSWRGATANPVINSDGWEIYQLADDASPYGIAYGSGYVWVSDINRQTMLRFQTGSVILQNKVLLPIVMR